MCVAGRADSPARVRLDESSLNATQRHRGVHNGNDDGALWPAETLQFEEKLVQLRNVIDSAIVMCEGNVILPDDLGLRDASHSDQLESLRIDFWERKLIQEALAGQSSAVD